MLRDSVKGMMLLDSNSNAHSGAAGQKLGLMHNFEDACGMRIADCTGHCVCMVLDHLTVAKCVAISAVRRMSTSSQARHQAQHQLRGSRPVGLKLQHGVHDAKCWEPEAERPQHRSPAIARIENVLQLNQAATACFPAATEVARSAAQFKP